MKRVVASPRAFGREDDHLPTVRAPGLTTKAVHKCLTSSSLQRSGRVRSSAVRGAPSGIEPKGPDIYVKAKAVFNS